VTSLSNISETVQDRGVVAI